MRWRTNVLSLNFIQQKICHPERSEARFLRRTESKNLQLLFYEFLRRRTRFFCTLASLILFAGVATGHAQPALKSSMIGHRAPEILRQDFNNHTISLANLHGRVVLLNFWASWCGPCLKEMPRFDELTKQFGETSFSVVGISIDDDQASAQSAVEKMHIHYPIAMGDAKLGKAYGGVLGVPITFLIDHKGVIRARYEGETDPKVIELKIHELLNQTIEK
jgi:cytochrome c biogenesis protein CcmG/thiol:disulfide interchange protein DsbE